MKISKIPGLGRFGIFIDDVDFDHITDEEWMEIGQLHLSSLVTILRDVKLTKEKFGQYIHKWGTERNIHRYTISSKYSTTIDNLLIRELTGDHKGIDPEDLLWLKQVNTFFVFDHNNKPIEGLIKVTGRRNNEGMALGMFAEGELLWHSNESGNLTFTPGVSLLACEGVVGSATGFLTTTDWYERQSESFRSELDEMVILHKFTPGKINPGLREDQDFIMNKNMCPVDNTPIPLVIQSPAGYKGLHYSVNTIDAIQGMSAEESKKLFERINKELFVDEYIYDHWYQNNNDLCLFDNSITLHRRLGGITNRLCYRMQYDYSKLYTQPYIPYLQEPFIGDYKKQIRQIVEYLDTKDFKLS
jgi:alpha-ketoglutarate-dependent taurine dioxygenase